MIITYPGPVLLPLFGNLKVDVIWQVKVLAQGTSYIVC